MDERTTNKFKMKDQETPITDEKWFWKINYCVRKNIPAAEAWAWKEAEIAYDEQHKTSLNMESDTEKSLRINTILHTKDGCKIGNAIIIDKNDEYNVVKTDYGNVVKLTDKEVFDYFHIRNTSTTHKNAKLNRSFEYKTVSAHNNDLYGCGNWAYNHLKELGEQGWEVVSIQPAHSCASYAFLKREVIN